MTRAANIILDCFAAYHAEFKQITRRARGCFEACDWHGLHDDANVRLETYRNYVFGAIEEINSCIGDPAHEQPFWVGVKRLYAEAVAPRHDYDIAGSFYNSVALRVLPSKGVDPEVHFLGHEFPDPPPVDEPAFKVYITEGAGSTADLLSRILQDCNFQAPFRDLEEDVRLAAARIDDHLATTSADGDPSPRIERMEIAEPVFYRVKGAYVVGRIGTTAGYVPLVLALFHEDRGIYMDAVLLTEDEVSIVFSFARSYFHVEVEIPRAVVRFLKLIMPLKPVAELYISLGYNKHGKTELYRDLVRHMNSTTDQFKIAPGERGMVMAVFTLPSYDVVFKIIKDRFDYPKRTTRQEVRNHYSLVFKHDRGGRLVDAQEFEHLRFDKERFGPELLEELLSVAGSTVVVEGNQVEVKHLYTERRLAPLNLYLRQTDEEIAEDTVIDYGQSIKDLAAANIFPGDILLKNFGVTRHGRVVFYDYDELCLITDCRFRELPEPEDPFDDMHVESWQQVNEEDVFPEELKTFLGLPPELSEVFLSHHSDLFTVEFWADLSARHLAGEVIDILPYREYRRLRHPGEDGAPGVLDL